MTRKNREFSNNKATNGSMDKNSSSNDSPIDSSNDSLNDSLNVYMISFLESIEAFTMAQQYIQRHYMNRGYLHFTRYRNDHYASMHEIVNGCLNRRVIVKDIALTDEMLNEIRVANKALNLQNEKQDQVCECSNVGSETNSQSEVSSEDEECQNSDILSDKLSQSESTSDIENAHAVKEHSETNLVENEYMNYLDRMYDEWRFGPILALVARPHLPNSEQAGIITDDVLQCKAYFEEALQRYIDLANLQRKMLVLKQEMEQLKG